MTCLSEDISEIMERGKALAYVLQDSDVTAFRHEKP